VSEANQKTLGYDTLYEEHTKIVREKEALAAMNNELNFALKERTSLLASVEEARKSDMQELEEMREKLELYMQEANHYKEIAEQSTLKQEMSQLYRELKMLRQSETEWKHKAEDAEREVSYLQSTQRQLSAEL